MSKGSRAVSPPRVVNIADMRRSAQHRLPKVVFDYLDGGADGEVTLRENCRVFDDVAFRPRHAVAFPNCDMHVRVLGQELSFPVILGPVGYSRLMHPDGELAVAAAAGARGTIYAMSTISGHALEKVSAASSGPVWYQLYLLGGRAAAEAAIERAAKAGFTALVVTIDTPVAGSRERDFRNGMNQLLCGSVISKLPHLPQLLRHPSWLTAFLLDGGVPALENVVVPNKGPMPLVDVAAALANAAITWQDFSWLRKSWSGPIIVKGVLTDDDARHAIDEGAAAIVVSNHGARQLDCVSPSLRALPEIVSAVNGQAEVLMDGGVRRGSDVVKALCLGARAVLIGRAYAYGLAAAGRAGVARSLEILHADIARTLKLLGCPSVTSLNSSYVDVPMNWQRNSAASR